MSLKALTVPPSPAAQAIANAQAQLHAQVHAHHGNSIASYDAVYNAIFKEPVPAAAVVAGLGIAGVYTASDAVAWLASLRNFILATNSDTVLPVIPGFTAHPDGSVTIP